jgi:hypothetical protein
MTRAALSALALRCAPDQPLHADTLGIAGRICACAQLEDRAGARHQLSGRSRELSMLSRLMSRCERMASAAAAPSRSATASKIA